jgi:hypothetical protein
MSALIKLALVSALAALSAVAATPASAAEFSASNGSVAARLTFDQPSEIEYTNLHLAVTRAGAPAFDAAVTVPECPEPLCRPSGFPAGSSALSLRDLDGDGEPEVLVDEFTGGAHCCSVTWILRWDGTTYTAVTRNWADPGYRLEDIDGDGVPEFRTADPRFAYAFTAYAFSGFPVMIVAYRQGVFRDVTRRHKALVERDARRQLREYRKRRGGKLSLGVLAAWTADQYLLGRRRAAHRFLDAERRAGRLRSPQGWKSKGAYIRQLERRLRAWGY